MNVTTKTAAVKLLDEYAGHLPRDFNDALRSLLSAQKEAGADQNVEAVRTKLLDRSRLGIAKYGKTTDRDDLSLQDWLVHMQEELLDGAVYIQAAMRNGQEPSAEHWRQAFDELKCNVYDRDWKKIEQRARVLARKGGGE